MKLSIWVGVSLGVLWVSLGIDQSGYSQALNLRNTKEMDHAISWLRTEPASLMDIGIMRMKIYAGKWWDLMVPDQFYKMHGKRILISTPNILFDEEEKKIIIYVDSNGPVEQEHCLSVLNVYKKVLNMLGGDSRSLLNNLFSHEGKYRDRREPPDLGKRLGEMIEVKVMLDEESVENGEYGTCRSFLVEDTVTFSGSLRDK